VNTEVVKLVHKERVSSLIDLLDGYPEDAQAVFDLTFVALVVAELQGVEMDSVYATLSQQYPLAIKFAGGI